MSGICVLNREEIENYREGRTPDHQRHEHISRRVAQERVLAKQAEWVSELPDTIVAIAPIDPSTKPSDVRFYAWDWQPQKSGPGGPTVMQLIR